MSLGPRWKRRKTLASVCSCAADAWSGIPQQLSTAHDEFNCECGHTKIIQLLGSQWWNAFSEESYSFIFATCMAFLHWRSPFELRLSSSKSSLRDYTIRNGIDDIGVFKCQLYHTKWAQSPSQTSCGHRSSIHSPPHSQCFRLSTPSLGVVTTSRSNCDSSRLFLIDSTQSSPKKNYVPSTYIDIFGSFKSPKLFL